MFKTEQEYMQEIKDLKEKLNEEAENSYFDITNNFKNYPKTPWVNSDDIACFGVPCDEGYTIMLPYEAAAFVSSNDITSMIALRIPKDQFDLLDDPEHIEEFGFEMKEEYFVDYKGKILI